MDCPVIMVIHLISCGTFICSDHDRLLCLLYERMEVPSGDPFPHFWTYRTPFTLAHLMQTLQNKDPNRKFPILHEFLKEVSAVNASTTFSRCPKALLEYINHILGMN